MTDRIGILVLGLLAACGPETETSRVARPKTEVVRDAGETPTTLGRDATATATPQPTTAANDQITTFADRACACADKDCATKSSDEFAVWLADNKNARGDETKAASDAERFVKCVSAKGGDLTKWMKAAEEAVK